MRRAGKVTADRSVGHGRMLLLFYSFPKVFLFSFMKVPKAGRLQLLCTESDRERIQVTPQLGGKTS